MEAGTESFSIDPRPRYRSPLAGGWSGGARRRKLARWNLRLRPIPRRKWKRRLWGFIRPPLIAATYRQAFVFAYRSVPSGGRRHRKYDGRTTMGSRRRWNKRAPPKISSAEPSGLRGELRADGGAAPVRLRIDIPGCANKRNPGGGKDCSASLFSLPFRPSVAIRGFKAFSKFLLFSQIGRWDLFSVFGWFILFIMVNKGEMWIWEKREWIINEIRNLQGTVHSLQPNDNIFYIYIYISIINVKKRS